MNSKNVPLALTVILFAGLCVTGCPTIDMSGSYQGVDFPFDGGPKLILATTFPAPTFTGTFILGLFGWYEIPICGTISTDNDVSFILHSEDPPLAGLCVCRGYDDGSSIFPGSGKVAGDGKADRVACRTLYGQPVDPPMDRWKVDW